MIKILFVLISFYCLSCISIKPLIQNEIVCNCENYEDNIATISEIDKNIKRYNPEISKAIYLIPNYGSPSKTIRIYKYRNNNKIERIFLFHFKDKYNYELKLDTLIIVGGKYEIKKKIIDDASVIISDIQDLIFYIVLYDNEYKELIKSSKILFKINDMKLEIEPNCIKSILF